MAAAEKPVVGVVMGSTSDWAVMSQACSILRQFGVPYEARALSAHRTPAALEEWIASLERGGARCIIAAAGGAAHLAGVVAAKTALPVLGVPMPSRHLQGLDSLLAMVQMPRGIPVATFAIGEAGAANAALFAGAMLALSDKSLAKKLLPVRGKQTAAVLKAAPLKLGARKSGAPLRSCSAAGWSGFPPRPYMAWAPMRRAPQPWRG